MFRCDFRDFQEFEESKSLEVGFIDQKISEKFTGVLKILAMT